MRKAQTEINNSAISNPNSALPEGWRWVRLGDMCEKPQYGYTASAESKPVGPKFLRITDIQDGQVNWDTVPYCSCTVIDIDKYLLEPGDILFARTGGTTGKSYLITEVPEAIFASYLIRVRPKDNLIPRFLYLFLQSDIYWRQVEESKRGGAQPNMNATLLANVTFPLPPLPEQKRIAAKIQELMHEVERTRSACEKQLEAAKALPAAYLRQVFESEEAKKWERKRLEEVCKVFSGSSAPQEKKYFENGKYPFVRVQDLGRYGRTTNLIEIKDYINADAIQELNLVKAEKGTILFPKSGAAITTNNRAILGIDAFIVSHLAALKPADKLANIFFVYFWLCLVDMILYMENPGYPSLKLSTISKIPIPLPSLIIQQRVAAELKEKMTYAEKLHTSIEKQLEALNALPQAILRKAFRGEL
ncbi:hypothetical protein CW713_07600 [Methanophagales archaeon]|nr:MAG: hypothetical protein CW713_07600 [Methanophagales archaeon]